MASLAEIRKRLAEQENKRNQTRTEGDGPVYPHWNIKDGDTAILRFVEDGNPDNPYFWVERAMFKFPFNGVKGDPSAGTNIIVQVPCMEMYGEKDAVLDEVRTWFKDSKLEDMGRKYWKKRSYLFQGFVRQDPQGLAVPENPIRRFVISPQIFTLIKNSLMDPEIENLPTDRNAGLDFRVVKVSGKGGFADYSTSSWARKESALTDAELEAIGKFGLSNLADFLPTKPTEEVQKVIYEMFEASVDGEPYDPARFGAYFTPPGMNRTGGHDSNTASTTSAATTSVKPTVPTEATPKVEPAQAETKVVEEPVVEKTDVETEAPAASSQKAQDILAMIRSRQKD